jgi:hypothetical protein
MSEWVGRRQGPSTPAESVSATGWVPVVAGMIVGADRAIDTMFAPPCPALDAGPVPSGP